MDTKLDAMRKYFDIWRRGDPIPNTCREDWIWAHDKVEGKARGLTFRSQDYDSLAYVLLLDLAKKDRWGYFLETYEGSLWWITSYIDQDKDITNEYEEPLCAIVEGWCNVNKRTN